MPTPLDVYMNPRPSVWREFVRGPLRSTLWITVGALIVTTLMVAAFEAADLFNTYAYELGHR